MNPVNLHFDIVEAGSAEPVNTLDVQLNQYGNIMTIFVAGVKVQASAQNIELIEMLLGQSFLHEKAKVGA